MIKQYLKKCRKRLSEILIGTLVVQSMLLGATADAQATQPPLSLSGPTGPDDYIGNLQVSPLTFNPEDETSDISFDIYQDCEIYSYFIAEDLSYIYVFEDFVDNSPGTVSYTWNGTYDNIEGGTSLPAGNYLVKVFAAINHIIYDSENTTATITSSSKSSYDIDIDEINNGEIGNDYPIDISINNEEPPGDLGYDNVLVRLTVDSSSGNFDMIVNSADDGTPYDLIDDDNYWGETGGFTMGATYSNTIPVTASFEDEGLYEITLDLIDLDNENAVFATTSESYQISDNGEEPENQSAYTINLPNFPEIVVNETRYGYLTVENTDPPGDMGYNNVLVEITVNGSAGSFDMLVEPQGGGDMYDLIDADNYWGETGGFELTPEYSLSIPVEGKFYNQGSYTVTADLIDVENENAVIATDTETYTTSTSGGDDGGNTWIPPAGGTGGVILQEDEDIADPFTDTEEHWAEEFIEELRLMGVVHGTEGGKFEPDTSLTRAEAVKIALGIYEIELLSDTVDEKPFPDVETDEWYAPYLETGKEYEIVSGYGDGLFRPNQVITRAEALRILLESSGLTIEDGETPYSDIEQYAWYKKYVAYATSIGLVEGYTDGTFRPYQPITRAEFSKLAVLLLEIL
ncbi:hypothetical protein GF366_04295 [Candidatus Peregrinibacteria bacterium]|nr:hypothetical protein [Candidatus Peregrinibacteria bacterium]